MSAIIDKTVELFAKHSKRLPQSMIIIYIYCVLFPQEAVELKNLLVSKIQIILPEAFMELFVRLHFTHNEIFLIWSFLLIIYAVTIVLDITNQLLRGRTFITIGPRETVLLQLNSFFFLSILIYNSLYHAEVRLSPSTFNGLYSFLLLFSILLFALTFFAAYCTGFMLVFKVINEPELSLIRRIIFNIIYWAAVAWILNKIYHTLI